MNSAVFGYNLIAAFCRSVNVMSEIIFEVRKDPECGYRARALGYPIFTQGETQSELKEMVRDAVRLYFEKEIEKPQTIKLRFVQETVIAG